MYKHFDDTRLVERVPLDEADFASVAPMGADQLVAVARTTLYSDPGEITWGRVVALMAVMSRTDRTRAFMETYYKLVDGELRLWVSRNGGLEYLLEFTRLANLGRRIDINNND